MRYKQAETCPKWGTGPPPDVSGGILVGDKAGNYFEIDVDGNITIVGGTIRLAL